MHPNAVRVVEAAASAGLAIDVVEYPEGTRTAAEAAAAVGAPVATIVKSLVFLVDDEPVMALVGGDKRLDETSLLDALDGATVARADADLVRQVTGYPIGGVPPFGHDAALPTVVDRGLLTHEAVWAAAGTPRHVFRIAPGQLVELSRASVADIAR